MEGAAEAPRCRYLLPPQVPLTLLLHQPAAGLVPLVHAGAQRVRLQLPAPLAPLLAWEAQPRMLQLPLAAGPGPTCLS